MTRELRRRHVRVLRPFDGRFGLFDTPVRLYDLSEGGCFILSLSDREIGHRFVLNLDLPDAESVTVTAEVLYKRPPFGFAVRFVDPPQDVAVRLHRALETIREVGGMGDATLPVPGGDPGPSPDCPKCPRPLVYITSAAGSHVYECPEHGGWRQPPVGLLCPYPIKDLTLDQLT